MQRVSRQRGQHRYVLTYSPEEDLTLVCESIIGMVRRSDVEFDLGDAAAVAEEVADQVARHILDGQGHKQVGS